MSIFIYASVSAKVSWFNCYLAPTIVLLARSLKMYCLKTSPFFEKLCSHIEKWVHVKKYSLRAFFHIYTFFIWINHNSCHVFNLLFILIFTVSPSLTHKTITKHWQKWNLALKLLQIYQIEEYAAPPPFACINIP